MAISQLSGVQVGTGQVKRQDMNTTMPGKAVVTRLLAGTNITLTSTGVGTGTGDITVNSA